MKIKIGCASLLLGGLALSANAATISWSTSAISGASDVNNVGSTVVAYNGAGNGVTANRVVNGVTFTPSTTLLGNSFTGDSWSGAGTGDYELMMSNIDYQTNGTGDLTLTTITGLSIGQDYVFQYWYADDNWAVRNREITISIVNTGGSPASTQTGDNTINGEEFTTATFKADSSSIDIITSSTHNGVRMTAMQLRAIPEPSVALLGGLGLLGLLRRRR
ncbi:MAG: PEP-CTERM sorting domain-containing protein [Roseibacillus sp.]